jgi:hypothetical protein
MQKMTKRRTTRKRTEKTDIDQVISEIGTHLKALWEQQGDALILQEDTQRSGELLKIIQLVDKYIALREKMSIADAAPIPINEQLVWNYLNKKREGKPSR